LFLRITKDLGISALLFLVCHSAAQLIQFLFRCVCAGAFPGQGFMVGVEKKHQVVDDGTAKLVRYAVGLVIQQGF